MLYQKQTKLALETFPISPETVHLEIIKALLQIKKAAARSHQQLGHQNKPLLNKAKAEAIARAVDELANDRLKP